MYVCASACHCIHVCARVELLINGHIGMERFLHFRAVPFRSINVHLHVYRIQSVLFGRSTVQCVCTSLTGDPRWTGF